MLPFPFYYGIILISIQLNPILQIFIHTLFPTSFLLIKRGSTQLRIEGVENLTSDDIEDEVLRGRSRHLMSDSQIMFSRNHDE